MRVSATEYFYSYDIAIGSAKFALSSIYQTLQWRSSNY